MYNHRSTLGQVSRSDAHHIDARLAALADLVLAVARVIATDARRDREIVDLTAIEINVMRYIDHHQGTSPTAVAAATGLRRSNVSRVLRDLEAKGMVERTADESDGRQTRLAPTARAETNLVRLRANWTRVLATVDVDRRSLDTTLATLAKIEAAIAPAAR
jgi:DNA-binding MarR family transcriptional regulator